MPLLNLFSHQWAAVRRLAFVLLFLQIWLTIIPAGGQTCLRFKGECYRQPQAQAWFWPDESGHGIHRFSNELLLPDSDFGSFGPCSGADECFHPAPRTLYVYPRPEHLTRPEPAMLAKIDLTGKCGPDNITGPPGWKYICFSSDEYDPKTLIGYLLHPYIFNSTAIMIQGHGTGPCVVPPPTAWASYGCLNEGISMHFMAKDNGSNTLETDPSWECHYLADAIDTTQRKISEFSIVCRLRQ